MRGARRDAVEHSRPVAIPRERGLVGIVALGAAVPLDRPRHDAPEGSRRWVQRLELEFVLRFREARRAIEEVVELPDRAANLFIKLCLSNGGKLSAARRKTHFSTLTEKETRAMERAVNAHMGRLVRSAP